ncbi:hypothetical protein M885DRAFT_591187 [Pelagophyceae sp. CCMP2097]|nr:hypothetical protein M885DRAFT_591187 [Pelagophyceae sp. CCMP2097]
METPAPLETTTCGPPLQEAVPSTYACRDTGRDVPFLNPGKCLGCQKMLSANVWTFSMARLCGEGDGELPSLYNACSKSCKAKFNGEKKSSAARQTILRQARGSILGTEIAEGDTVYVFDDKTPNRFVDADPGVVLCRQNNKATGQADLVVSSLLNTAVRTVGPSGLRLVKADVDAPRPTRTSPLVDGEPASAPGRDASAAATMASTRRRGLEAEADASDLRRQRDEGRLREEDLRRRLEAAEFFGKGAAAENKRTLAILQSVRLEALVAESRLERERNKNDMGTTRVEERAFAKAHRQLSFTYAAMSSAATMQAMIVCATRNAKKGSTREEMVAAGAGGALAAHNTKAALEAHSENARKSHDLKATET